MIKWIVIKNHQIQIIPINWQGTAVWDCWISVMCKLFCSSVDAGRGRGWCHLKKVYSADSWECSLVRSAFCPGWIVRNLKQYFHWCMHRYRVWRKGVKRNHASYFQSLGGFFKNKLENSELSVTQCNVTIGYSQNTEKKWTILIMGSSSWEFKGEDWGQWQ